MILKRALEKTQKSGAQYYRNLAQTFESNQLIHETWAAMAQDMEQQASGFETLPPGFWKKFKDSAEPLLEALKASAFEQVNAKKENGSLHACFERTLNLEEPLILKAYVPIIRMLRLESTSQALELYIMVKAHVNSLLRLIQPFEGDPAVLGRVILLQEKFEQEVQAPDPEVVKQTKRRQYTVVIPALPPEERKAHKPKSSTRQPKKGRSLLSLSKRQIVAKHAKPLVGKIELRRTRARG